MSGNVDRFLIGDVEPRAAQPQPNYQPRHFTADDADQRGWLNALIFIRFIRVIRGEDWLGKMHAEKHIFRDRSAEDSSWRRVGQVEGRPKRDLLRVDSEYAGPRGEAKRTGCYANGPESISPPLASAGAGRLPRNPPGGHCPALNLSGAPADTAGSPRGGAVRAVPDKKSVDCAVCQGAGCRSRPAIQRRSRSYSRLKFDERDGTGMGKVDA